MKTLKLIALLLVFVISIGSIVYRVLYRRPAPAAVVVPDIQPQKPAAPAPPPAPASVLIREDSQRHPIIPPNGWGRNPFLTPEDIQKANQPPAPEIVEAPPAPPPVPAAPAPPTYTVSAIIYGPNGGFAVVNSRVVQRGDRLGVETVKEISRRAVVLEYEGQTRELPLRKLGPEIQIAVPKGD